MLQLKEDSFYSILGFHPENFSKNKKFTITFINSR